MTEIWQYGHITIWLYGIKDGQYGCCRKKQKKCSNPAKEISRFNLPVRNEVYLFSEFKQVDFFIKSSDRETIETVLSHLKKWSKISLLYQVDTEVIKKQLNIIFD